ncbi:heat shock 70 kDa protein 12B-like isoform X2 [Mobula birostris]|uniref:heat shock 70 kDa protein 12B-like isoform X2 n=1 Tax=Mobula birostris TaxID=1983395 RepID=UPI003B28AEC4
MNSTIDTPIAKWAPDPREENPANRSPGNGSALQPETCAIAPLTPRVSPCSPRRDAPPSQSFLAVVAIDFGTTASGYAYCLVREPGAIHMMRRWEGGDPGVANQKSPTCLLLTPEGSFHSVGYTARDFYHSLDPGEASEWLYFDKFKMKIHTSSELSEHLCREPEEGEVRWVVTVPAIWKQPARQFMREAAYLADLTSPDHPERLLLVLEPEAASIYCRRLRPNQLTNLSASPRTPEPSLNSSFRQAREQLRRFRNSRIFLLESGVGELWAGMESGDRYMVADCGGGTVDLTVHEIEQPAGTLKELYKASGGPYGAVGVDLAFQEMLCQIFGCDLMEGFRLKRPAAWVDLMMAFEARKQSISHKLTTPLNISLPFSFTEFYRKHRGECVEAVLKKCSNKLIKWSSQGMLQISPQAADELFQPTIRLVVQHIEAVLQRPEAAGVRSLFLVGGFAASGRLQREVERVLPEGCRLLLPQASGLSTLQGAVLLGLEPAVVRLRRSPLTYGLAVLRRFEPGRHPAHKLLERDGARWCADVFDRLVRAGQPLAPGERLQRRYMPARPGQRSARISLYCAPEPGVRFVSDPGVRRCATLSLDLGAGLGDEPVDGTGPGDEPVDGTGPEADPGDRTGPGAEPGHGSGPGAEPGYGTGLAREIRVSLQFGDTEIKVTALDILTGAEVRATLDWLSE